MRNLLLKQKSIITLFIFLGVLSFSVCHASIMPQGMDKNDCYAQSYCGACPVPVVSNSPSLNNFLIQIHVLSEKLPCLPDSLRDSLYHPPR